MADEAVGAHTVNARWRGDEGERGAEINHLTSGWSVHLCLGDKLQIGCDIQEHLGGHGSVRCSHSNTHTHTHTHTHSHTEVMSADKHIYVQRGIGITPDCEGVGTETRHDAEIHYQARRKHLLVHVWGREQFQMSEEDEGSDVGFLKKFVEIRNWLLVMGM